MTGLSPDLGQSEIYSKMEFLNLGGTNIYLLLIVVFIIIKKKTSLAAKKGLRGV